MQYIRCLNTGTFFAGIIYRIFITFIRNIFKNKIFYKNCIDNYLNREYNTDINKR